MSENYTPRPDTQSVPPYNTVVLSQRDLGLRVPINFVTDPGVSLKAACFNENRYEDDSAGDCISDLLAVGFRRFELDLYWNDARKVWSFCPVAIPPVIANLTPLSTVTPFPYPVTNSNFSQFPSPATISSPTPQSSSSTSPNLNARQMTASTLASPSPTSMDEPSLGQSLPSTSSILDLSNNPLVAIGPYVCTTTINLSTFTSLLLDYIQKTETTLQAHLLYLILNIHAASSELDPGGPAPLPSILPHGSSELLGELFAENLTNYIYSEFNLLSDRINLNDSWYNIREEAYRPVNGYYDTTRTPNGVLTTEDGWPSEGYIEFANSKRLLVGYGNIDPQMSDYNFTGDAGTIFRDGFIQDLQRNVTATADGVITSGCFMNNDTIELAQRNSSWAVLSSLSSFGNPTAASADLTPLLNLTSSATNCGISPHLNTTLLGTSASTNSSPYSAFSQSTIWSWAPNEPQNASTTSDSPSPDSRIFRCAISNKDRDGRWVVDNCSAKRFAACQASSQPYNWTITDEETVYSFAAAYCPEAYTFAAPRTALENAYLTLAMQRSGRNWNGHGAWVDFNSLDIEGCWVTGGQNATCPYKNIPNTDDERRVRSILVPLLLLLIILLLSIITGVLKCFGKTCWKRRSNRKNARASRAGRTGKGGGKDGEKYRNANGFIYEGVPS